MSQRSKIAERHRRTRSDHSQETAEDYVEAVAAVTVERGVCRVVDLARRFDVSHVTVTKVVARLKRDGLMTSEKYGPIRLTERGEQLAREAKERHETVYQFLLSIGVSPEVAEIDAEGIEHHVSPETMACFRAAKLASAVPQ